MASGSGGSGGTSLHSLIGGREMTGARLSRSGDAQMSGRDYYKELRGMGASRSEARQMTNDYLRSTRRR